MSVSAVAKVAAVVIVPLLAVVGISQAVPDDEPMTEFPGKPRPSSPKTVSAAVSIPQEQDFLDIVASGEEHYAGFATWPDEDLIGAGHLACDGFDEGFSAAEVVATASEGTGEELLPVFYLVETATLTLCPRYRPLTKALRGGL